MTISPAREQSPHLLHLPGQAQSCWLHMSRPQHPGHIHNQVCGPVSRYKYIIHFNLPEMLVAIRISPLSEVNNPNFIVFRKMCQFLCSSFFTSQTTILNIFNYWMKCLQFFLSSFYNQQWRSEIEIWKRTLNCNLNLYNDIISVLQFGFNLKRLHQSGALKVRNLDEGSWCRWHQTELISFILYSSFDILLAFRDIGVLRN